MSILKEAYEFLYNEKTYPKLYFVSSGLTSKDGKKTIFFDVKRCGAKNTILESLKEIPKAKLKELSKNEKVGELRIREYKPGSYTEDSSISTAGLDEIEIVNQLKEKLRRVDQEIIQKEEYLNINSTVMAFKNKKHQDIYLFQKFTKRKVVKAGNFQLKNGLLTKVKEDFIILDNSIDFFLFNDKIVLLNEKRFEQFFHLNELFAESLKQMIKTTEIAKILKNPKTLINLCETDFNKMRKLKRVVDNEEIEIPSEGKIRHIINEFDLEIKLTENNEIVINENAKSKELWTILRLLEDDYLKSPATDNKYTAQSKELKK